MQPQSWPEPDPQVAAAIRAMYRGRREAPLAVQVRDRLGELFPDAAFADAFGQVGKPGWSPGRLALVTVLQKAANLTDRQAADEVRENLAWKYALGLNLEDPGFEAMAIVVAARTAGEYLRVSKGKGKAARSITDQHFVERPCPSVLRR